MLLIMNLGLLLGLLFFGSLILNLKATPLYLSSDPPRHRLYRGGGGGNGDDREDTRN